MSGRTILQPGEALREIERIVQHTDFGVPGQDAPCPVCHKALFELGQDSDEPQEFLNLGYLHSSCIVELLESIIQAGFVSSTDAQKMFLDGRGQGWDAAIQHLQRGTALQEIQIVAAN